MESVNYEEKIMELQTITFYQKNVTQGEFFRGTHLV